MIRARAWLLLLLLVLPACLDAAPAPGPPTAVVPETALPLPRFHYPATPGTPVVVNGRAYAVLNIAHFAIRYTGDDASDVAALPALIDALEAGYAQLSVLLGEAPTYAIPVRLEHDLTVSHAEPGMVLYRRDIPYADQATHELAHIFTSYIGYPFLEEGLAVYTSMLLDGSRPWPMNGVSAGRQMAAALAGARYTPLSSAFRFAGLGTDEFGAVLDRANMQTMYLEAGAFAQFMIGRYGLPAYRALLEKLDPATGSPVPGQVANVTDLDSAFRAWLVSPAADTLPPPPPALPAAPLASAAPGAPAAAALLQGVVQHWQAAKSVHFEITKLGYGDWVAPDSLHLTFVRPDNQQEVIVQGDAAYQQQNGAWTRLSAAQTPESTLAGAWQGIGAAATPAGPVLATTVDGQPAWRASYYLPQTPDMDRYGIAADNYITLVVGAADGRVYRFLNYGYEERFSAWDGPVTILHP